MPMLEHIMNMMDVQVMINPNPDRTSLGSCLRPCRRTELSIRFGTIDECAALQDQQQDHMWLETSPRCCFGATHLVGELPRSNGQTTAWPSAPSRARR